MVEQFYHYALEQTTLLYCVCGLTEIKASCMYQQFEPQLNNTNLDLWWTVLNDAGKVNESEKVFPYVLPLHLLPEALSELEELSVARSEQSTISAFDQTVRLAYAQKNQGLEDEVVQDVVALPNDVDAFSITDDENACRDMNQKMHCHSLIISATALTEYLIGVTLQMALAAGNDAGIEQVMQEHVLLVYNIGRCQRTNGRQLQVPTVYMNEVRMKGELTMRTALVNQQLSWKVYQTYLMWR